MLVVVASSRERRQMMQECMYNIVYSHESRSLTHILDSDHYLEEGYDAVPVGGVSCILSDCCLFACIRFVSL